MSAVLIRLPFNSPRVPSSLSISFVSWVVLASGCQSATCDPTLLNNDGVCIELKCDAPCGSNQFCNTDETPPACVCAAGFSGNPCTFSGLIEDPDFYAPLDDSPWGDTQGATIENTAATPIGTGKGVLLPGVVCNAGQLWQEVRMPSMDSAPTFVAELHYRARGVHGLALGLGGAWTRLAPTRGEEWARGTRVCLGEAAYGPSPGGGPVRVQLSAAERLADCLEGSPEGTIEIDRFDIVPADPGECPEPGTVVNSAADTDGPDWRFLEEGDVDADLVEDAGREGTSGARLFRDAEASGRATMSTRISVPFVESPAVRFWWRATRQQAFDATAGTLVDLDDRGRQADTLVGTVNTSVPNNAGVSRLYCLPPWTQGTVIEWSFSLPAQAADEPVELVVDDLELTTDESCGTDDALLDGGFESAPRPWFGASLLSADEAIFMREDEGLAKEGSGLLELTYWTSAPGVAMETYVRVPEDEPNPALIFQSRSPREPSVDVRWFLGQSEVTSAPVQAVDEWQPNEVCLPPAWAGRWFRVSVRAAGLEPAAPIAQERVYLDDFVLGSCSAE